VRRRAAPSLQGRLAWRLGAVLVVALAAVTGVVVHYAWSTIESLDDASLQVQAAQIAKHLSGAGAGLRLELPASAVEAYRGSGDGYIYAVLDAEARPLVASSPRAGELAASAPTDARTRSVFFRLPSLYAGGAPYYALAQPAPGLPGLTLVVAQNQIHADVLADTMIAEFIEHVGWMIAAGFALSLAIAVWTIRTSLRPLKALSARAAEIGPRSTGLRLPFQDVPAEILPLVRAVNEALERLEGGFEAQRRFTASAAHELRTPLAILTARLDELGPESAQALQPDVRRINRVVEQLLRVARLDSGGLDLSQPVDLRDVAAEVVGYMAPLAIRGGRSLSLSTAPGPVRVLGDAGALGDALRNLVENAILLAPAGSEVEVRLAADGRLTVRDRGPGLRPEERELAFRRFWRGRGARGAGAGLGLTIVAETARAHGGDVSVEANEAGGSDFTIRLPLAA